MISMKEIKGDRTKNSFTPRNDANYEDIKL